MKVLKNVTAAGEVVCSILWRDTNTVQLTVGCFLIGEHEEGGGISLSFKEVASSLTTRIPGTRLSCS
jgi:hypothetical protein